MSKLPLYLSRGVHLRFLTSANLAGGTAAGRRRHCSRQTRRYCPPCAPFLSAEDFSESSDYLLNLRLPTEKPSANKKAMQMTSHAKASVQQCSWLAQVEQLLAQQEKALLEADASLLAPVRASPQEFGEG